MKIERTRIHFLATFSPPLRPRILRSLFTEVEVASGGKYSPLATHTEVNNCFSIY